VPELIEPEAPQTEAKGTSEMMVDLQFLLIALAFTCFVFSALGVSAGRVGLLPLGLAFWALSILVR
jgi:hypothetical protein